MLDEVPDNKVFHGEPVSRPDCARIARLFLSGLEQPCVFSDPDGAAAVAWQSLMAENVLVRFPYAPPGLPRSCNGRAEWLSSIRDIFAAMNRLTWLECNVYPTTKRDLVFATGRSNVLLRNGATYQNEYCFIFGFKDDKISEYVEFFDPTPVMALAN